MSEAPGTVRVAEPPSSDLAGGGCHVGIVVGGPTGREDPAVLGAKCARPVLVDGTPVVRKHRASTAFVISHGQMATSKPRCREQQLRSYTTKGVCFVGFDMDEL
jgi:hypothetical protein